MVELTDTTLRYISTTSSERKYRLDLEFYGEINRERFRKSHLHKATNIVIEKKETNVPYWPRLLKDDKKPPYINIDYRNWVKEGDERPDEPNEFGHIV